MLVALRAAVVAGVLLALAGPVIGTATGLREGGLVNGDEAVAALLPAEFVDGGAGVLFPGNAYQGVMEVPVYGAVWWLLGADLLVLRLFHQALWVAAVAVWFVVALEPGRRDGSTGPRAYWWSAFTVAGLLGVTSVVGWPVWYRVYPGYQLGALLGGLGVLVALRARERDASSRWWFAAGLLCGAAVYAQPMHLAAGVAVVLLAAARGRPGVAGRVGASLVGGVLGVAPLLVWNLRNGMAILDPDGQPSVEHPEWGYPQRWVGLWRTTERVLWGGDQIRTAAPWSIAALVCAGAALSLAIWGAVALARRRGSARVLLVVPAVTLLGLPLLRVMSLQADPRYAVGWWPGLVVLGAAGAAAAASLRGPGGRVLRAALVALVALHLAVVARGATVALDRDRPDGSTVEVTSDLVRDLRRCGVDAVWGDYWAVYPLLWSSGAGFAHEVQWGPQRLTAIGSGTDPDARRVAVLVPSVMTDTTASARLVADGTTVGQRGWIALVHPPSGARIALEETGAALPPGCVGSGGLRVEPS